MFSTLLCYVLNPPPEILRVGKRLDVVVQYMVKYRPVEEMRIHVEGILQDVQQLLESRDSLVAPSAFSPVDLLLPLVDSLELSSETTLLNRADRSQCLEIDTESDGESPQGKCPRLSL
jgi:hypothetical protein